MKKTFAKIAAAIVVIAFIGVSCTEDDITNPTITLTGGATMTLDLGATYTDPGFTANDDKDGDLTSQVTVTGTVNTSQVGAYEITYTVSDEAGNSTTETRMVYVRANALAGSYSVHAVVTGAGAGTYDYTEVVTASGVDYNKIIISDFNYYPNLTVSATVTGSSISFNETKSYDWDGDGTATSADITGTTLNAFEVVSATVSRIVTLSFTINYGGGQVDQVVATYTKN
ncbi:MAG: hypothetical protein CVU11_11845 [Bacteroidetes bacterium HGW-Bacteroidetes-6]|jgi:hypothetical protein|nr:MAG: hypothetical protein CVU11_11845 [Bacteroidetes bacterium HGW-Bacteroidetes-6]